jgi:hypothetical protein
MSTIEISQADADALIALREAARTAYNSALYLRATQGAAPARTDVTMQRLMEAVRRADAVGFKPKAAPKRTRKAKA